MDYSEFVGLVLQMRAAQKAYWRYLTTEWLERATDLERRVDKLLFEDTERDK